MIKLKENMFLVQDVSELPNLLNRKEIFLDVETRNYTLEKIQEKYGKPKPSKNEMTEDENKSLEYGGLYPFRHDRICGIAISSDDDKETYYIPVRHKTVSYRNLPTEIVIKWLQGVLDSCDRWINHNIKFDAHFLAVDGLQINCEMCCTLSMSKIYDSDRMSNGLKELSSDYLGFDTGMSDRVSQFLQHMCGAGHWHNYAVVPMDILGEYACDDVRMNRELYRFFMNNIPEDQMPLLQTEIKMTTVLFDMEYVGMRIDPQECAIAKLQALQGIIRNGTTIQDLTGVEFTDSNKCIEDILFNQFGMPCLATKRDKNDKGMYFDTGRATFDKEALPLYRVHHMAMDNKAIADTVDAILEFRSEANFKGLYPDTFLRLHDIDNMIHPSYNQMVRTGRMSCSRPNSQQQTKRSKSLIHPRPGYGFISCDYSQIEFRLIAHYIQDEDLIRAYNEDASTDFHQWVALLMHVTRKVGKVLNFGMAYGQGQNGVIAKLMANPDIIEEISKKIIELDLPAEQREVMFRQLCSNHSRQAYNKYHIQIPGLKATANRAMSTCRARGYVFNAYRRRRHLKPKFCRKAFNSIIQSCAGDLVKERMVALHHRWNRKMADWGIRMVAQVHDELLFEVPIDLLYSTEVHNYIVSTMESPEMSFRVPIRTGMGIGPNSWAEAVNEEKVLDDRGNFVSGCLIA